MAIKSPKEIEARRAYIHDITPVDKAQQLSIFSFSDIKNLSDQDVLYRIDSITNQSALLKWRLWAKLRDRYPSTNAWGEFLEEARNRPDRADCVIDQRDIYRCIMAGRFCERHKIGDLNKAGVRKTVIYLLSQKGNRDVADSIFQRIRRNNTPVETVQQMISHAKREIEQAKAVLTIEKQPESQTPELMEYERPEKPYTVQVEAGVAKEEIERVIEQEHVKPVFVSPEPEQAAAVEIDTLKYEITLDNEARITRNNVTRRMSAILELWSEKPDYLDREQQKEEIKTLVKGYGLSFMAEAGLLQECAKEIAAKGYGK